MAKFHCNECYSKEHKSNEEGCFTNDTKAFIEDKVSPCLDGTWAFALLKHEQGITFPLFEEIINDE